MVFMGWRSSEGSGLGVEGTALEVRQFDASVNWELKSDSGMKHSERSQSRGTWLSGFAGIVLDGARPSRRWEMRRETEKLKWGS